MRYLKTYEEMEQRYMYPVPNGEIKKMVDIFRNMKSDFKLIRNAKTKKNLSNNNENEFFIYFSFLDGVYKGYNSIYFKIRSYYMAEYEVIEDYGIEVEDIDLELNTLKYNL